MIEFRGVTKQYGEQVVLSDFSVTIESGEFFVLVGPSGSGKTTTLKMINRLIEPTQGDIYFQEKRIKDYDIRELRLNIGYVLQQIALFPNLTVAENIELIPEMKKWSKEKRLARTIELLEKVGLDPAIYLQRKPAELSGGEQQRIGILRAIAASPDVILMDEPFSALDPISRKQLQDLVKELHREMAGTIIFVTHDMHEAMELGDRICLMQDGKLVQVDTPEQIKAHPANAFVAEFFKQNASMKEIEQERYTVRDIYDLECFSQGSPLDLAAVEAEVGLDATLEELLQQLLQHEAVKIVENGQVIGELREKSILQFLKIKLNVGEA